MIKKSGSFILLIILLFAFTSVLLTAASKRIKPDEAKLLYDKGVTFIDVRTLDEYSAGHVKGALNIDFYSKDFKLKLSKLDKSKQYVVYCRSGNRSGQSVTMMEKMGFKELYDLGAFSAWQDAGYPVE